MHKTTGETPLKLLCGREGRLPIDIDRWSPNQSFLEDIDVAWKEARSHILKSAEYTESRATPLKTIDNKIGSWVRLSALATNIGPKAKLRRDKWHGPYKIVDKNDKSNVCLGIEGKSKWVQETRTQYSRLSKPPDRL